MSRETDPATRIRRTLRDLRAGWWAFALVVAAVVCLVAWVYLAWIVFGLFVYYVARPIERRTESLIRSRGVAAALTLLVVVVPVVATLGAAVLLAVVETVDFLTGDVAALVDRYVPVLASVVPDEPDDLLGVLGSVGGGPVQSLFGSIQRTVGSAAGALFDAFLSFLFAFFLLREDDALAAWFRTAVADEGTDTYRFLRSVDRGLESVYFGYTATIFVVVAMAVVTYGAFNLIAPPGLRLPSPVTLAVLTGLFTVVPLVGRSIVYVVVTASLVLASLRAGGAGLWFPVLFFVVMELPFDNLVRVYVRPRLSGRLFPMGLLVFAYLVGPAMFGWYGVFYGPLLLVVVLVFLRDHLPALLHPDRQRNLASQAATDADWSPPADRPQGEGGDSDAWDPDQSN